MRIGVDIGGSHIAVGLVNNMGSIIEKIEKDWDNDERKDFKNSIKSNIINLSKKILENNGYTFNDIEMIGIGSPGTIMNGKILNAKNLGIDVFDIKTEIQNDIDIKVCVRNDAKCAAIYEKKYGNIKDYSDVVFLTLGTGIGGAVFLDGKLLEPKRFSGFEIGHIIIQKDGLPCSCGKKGCFETYASMKSLKKMFAERFFLDSNKKLHSTDILKLAEEQGENPIFIDIIKEYIDNLITGLVNLIDLFEPEVICLGGGFIYYKDLLYPLIKESLCKANNNFNKGSIPEITIAKMGNDAGIIGAAMQD